MVRGHVTTYIGNTPSKLQMPKPDMLNIEHDFTEKY